MGKTMIKQGIKELEQSPRVKGSRIGLNSNNAMNAKAVTENIITRFAPIKVAIKTVVSWEKGKLYNVCEKPYLTDEQREARV